MAASTINWKNHGEARDISKSTNKMQIIYFATQWCAYCRKMEKDTFGDEGVISFMNENFISSRVDITKEKEIAGHFGVRAVPVTWFVTPEGLGLRFVPGYIDAETFLWMLKYVHSEKYKTSTFKEFMKSKGKKE